MNQSLDKNFKSLLAHGLISEEQYQQATTHERFADQPNGDSDADALFRLVTCGVVKEQELHALADELASMQGSNSERREKLDIVNEALSYIDSAVRIVNSGPLDVLLSLGVINAEQHEEGLDIRPTRAEGLMDSPARALAILVGHGVVPGERLEEIKRQELENSQGANAKERLTIATEAAQIHHDIVGQYVKAMAGGAFKAFGLMMLVIFGVIGLAVWLLR